LRVTTGLISRCGFSPLVHFQDTPGPIGRTVADVAKLLDAIVGYDPKDPFTVTASAAPNTGGYARAVDIEVPAGNWRVGVLESAFGSDTSADTHPVNHAVRAAVAHLQALGVSVTPDLEIPELTAWISGTSVYAIQSRADITDFLSKRPHAPVSSFDEIYQSASFDPLNDLFHDIAKGADHPGDDRDHLRRRLDQEHFRRLLLNMFAANEIDFMVYPTVQVLPPTHQELAEGKYQALTFPTNTVIASQAGLPALTIPVGFSEARLPVGLEVMGPPLSEAKMLQFARAWELAARPRTAPSL